MAGATLPLSPDPFAGQTLGKYEVLCRLSTGGMSEIFLAFQRGLAGFRKLLVIKSILPDIRGEEEFVRMFLDEAKITAAFNHPNIAQVYDLDIDDDQLFLAMEFIPGCTLVELARACRAANESIPTGLTLLAVKETALALHYAHTFTDQLGNKQTVIHRDVAEKNIMVTYEGTTKLLDFGIAKSLNKVARTTVGMVKGTSGYMSPEQILGEPLDARSDLFSLGVVLHECLTGMRLFHGKDAEAGMLAALKEDAQAPSRLNPDITPELDAVVLKSLARKRDARYATCLEFARALEKAAGALTWHPEQSGELVQRMFKDRRDQTRQLLEQAQSEKSEVTGEIRLAGLLGDPPSATPHKAAPSLATPRKPYDSVNRPAAEPRTPTGKRPAVSPSVAPLPVAKGPGQRPPPEEHLTTDKPTPVTAHAIITAPSIVLPDSDSSSDVTRVVGPPRSKGATPSGPVPWSKELVSTPPSDGAGMKTIPSSSLPADLFDLIDPAPGRSKTGESVTAPDPRRQDKTESRFSNPLAPELGPEQATSPGLFGGHARSRIATIAVGAVLGLIVVAGVGYLLGVERLFTSAPTAEKVDQHPSEPIPDPVKPPEKDPAPIAVKDPAPSAPSGTVAPPVTADPEPPKPDPEPPPRPEPEPEPVAAKQPGSVQTVSKPVRPPVRPPRKPRPEPVDRTEKAWASSKKGPTGQLTLVTEPWAKVVFKSEELGVTPLFKVNLPVGRQTLKLIGADQRVLLLPVDIKEGSVTAVRVPLSGLKPE